jgi:AcrR family transcriptional regulator
MKIAASASGGKTTAPKLTSGQRTAARILDVALVLFNRFGEPNVSTTLLVSELHISPGNLYYHYPAKEALVNALYDRYTAAMSRILAAAPGMENVEDAWFFIHAVFECIWEYRFLYRDLNDLLSRNRKLEIHFQQIIVQKQQAVHHLLHGLSHRWRGQSLDGEELEPVATAMVVVLIHWLSFEYERHPRLALETADKDGQQALMRGAYHVLSLLNPYLEPTEKAYLRRLARAYLVDEKASSTSNAV